jgi:hypothetical protein
MSTDGVRSAKPRRSSVPGDNRCQGWAAVAARTSDQRWWMRVLRRPVSTMLPGGVS